MKVRYPKGTSKKRQSGPAYRARGALRAVVGNTTVTSSAVIAWYVLEPVSTSFQPDADVEGVIRSTGSALASLTGRQVYWRVTTRPYAVRQWAEQTHLDAVAAGDPLPAWAAAQLRDQEYLVGSSLSEKWVYLGVRVATSRRHQDPRREVEALAETLAEVSDNVASYGLEAHPADPLAMEWLLRRSVGLGLPAPAIDSSVLGDYDGDDLPELWEHARWSCEPWGRSLKVAGTGPDGRPVERYVGVLTMGRMEAMDIPQDPAGGWMQRTDRLPFPVEWFGTTDIISSEKVTTRLRHQMDVIDDQYKHYRDEHHVEPPEALKRQHSLALETEDEVARGLGGLATRTDGWYRLAVWGESETQVLTRVREVQKIYGSQVCWVHSWDQYRLAREFIAGEPLANTAHRRRMSVTALAAALPAASAEIGDRIGAVLGWTSGSSRRAVIWHPWRDMEGPDRSGLLVVAGELGSGKTVASAGLVYRTAVAGVPWHVFDPTGRLRALTELPEFAGRARFIDLLRGRAGELNPYRVVAEPVRLPDESDEEWEAKQLEAPAQRRNLCKDVLRGFLPREVRQQPEASSVLTRAVNAVEASIQASPRHVLTQLLRIADGQSDLDLTPTHRIIARDIHTELHDLAQTPNGRLIFDASYLLDYGPGKGPVNRDGTPVHRQEPILTIYGLNGMSIPTAATLAGGDESIEVRMSIALLNLAAWLVQRSIYQGDPNRRKGLMIDEGHMLAALDAGRTLIQKSATDSRKHNTRVILCSQNVTHFDQGDIGNLVGAALIGRTEDVAAAQAALSVLKVAQEPAYVAVLAGLSPRGRTSRARSSTAAKPARKLREFIFSDGRGGVERIVLDLYAHPHVLDAIDTTADPTRRKEIAA